MDAEKRVVPTRTGRLAGSGLRTTAAAPGGKASARRRRANAIPHSCLVPVSKCLLPMIYVFVHIAFDPSHFVRCLKDNFGKDSKLALTGTIQFIDTLHRILPELHNHFGANNLHIPQAKPLSRGELLGCTSPKISGCDALVYVGDGRFHLESAMISNPNLAAYRYDPYSKTMSVERYDHTLMRKIRLNAIDTARTARIFAVILGTLGRQGSTGILQRLESALRESGKLYTVVLLSEITADKLLKLEAAGIEAWIQIACPRLSIDWGTNYGEKPLLTPYEAFVALGKVEWREKEYPMDFYAKESGPWTNYYKPTKEDDNKAINARKSSSCCQKTSAAHAPAPTGSLPDKEVCESSDTPPTGGCCKR